MASPWFDTTLSLTIASNGELSVALGSRSLVLVTGSSSFQIYGIAAVGGNQDGMVVVVANIQNGAASFTALNESLLASSPLNRLRNHNANDYAIGISTPFGSGSGVGAAVYRYFGTTQRWIMMSRT